MKDQCRKANDRSTGRIPGRPEPRRLLRIDRDGKAVFVPTHWKLLTLQDLEVDLKFEFNQSNRGLYGNTIAALAEAVVR